LLAPSGRRHGRSSQAVDPVQNRGEQCPRHRHSADPTIGACWDADRLNLWRVGVAPARRLLSTAAARSAEVYEWSRGVNAGDVGLPELAVGTGRSGKS
jgi:hypothetical protein